MQTREIPDAVAAFARSELGPDLEFRFAGWPHAQSRIWRAQTPSGVTFYVKQHAEASLFSRHRFACQHWVPQLPVRVPELIAVSDESLKVMIFSEVPGQVLAALELPLEHELEMYRSAGKAARCLHSLPQVSPADFDAAADFRAALQRYCAQAEGLIPRETLDWALAHAGDAASFRGLPLVPCHRDFTPRNWLVDMQGGRPHFSLIDFERARLDLALFDFVGLWLDYFQKQPARQRAFFEGYGRALSETEEFNLRLLALRTSISSVVWARQNSDPDFERKARGALDRLRSAVTR